MRLPPPESIAATAGCRPASNRAADLREYHRAANNSLRRSDQVAGHRAVRIALTDSRAPAATVIAAATTPKPALSKNGAWTPRSDTLTPASAEPAAIPATNAAVFQENAVPVAAVGAWSPTSEYRRENSGAPHTPATAASTNAEGRSQATASGPVTTAAPSSSVASWRSELDLQCRAP